MTHLYRVKSKYTHKLTISGIRNNLCINLYWLFTYLFKALLEIHQAALQDADLVMCQLLERAVGSAHQADIVSSVSTCI